MESTATFMPAKALGRLSTAMWSSNWPYVAQSGHLDLLRRRDRSRGTGGSCGRIRHIMVAQLLRMSLNVQQHDRFSSGRGDLS